VRFHSTSLILGFISAAFLLASPGYAQKKQTPETAPANLSRTLTRNESRRLAFGGTVTIAGAPVGSVTVEGWSRNEVQVTAEIEWRAGSGEDLDRLAVVNNFVIDSDTNSVRIITTGTHDKKFMKQAGKNFPKNLLGLPWKIDYKVQVPEIVDLEIDSGVGAIKLAGVEGAIRLNALQSDADLSLTGGFFRGVIQRGAVTVRIPSRSWHGMGAMLQLAGGTLNVSLMPGFSGDIDATVVRLGEVKNSYPALEPRENGSHSRLLLGRAGVGGAKLSFTVGDGTIELKQSEQ
jgi:hypothetical protein